ncbi:MAG: type II secretion system GspH family protein [Opitutales bacterium]|nr:type II secretion system GspH family protein [Opitutales bacterium]
MKKLRKAFTLVEILVTISVIVVLVSITLGLAGPVSRAINNSNAKTQRDRLVLGLGQFKNTYGEFPMAPSEGSAQVWNELLIDSLRGDRILVRKNGMMQVVAYNDTRKNAERRAFVELSNFTLDEDDTDSAKAILDPWENPWAYRYNHIVAGKAGKVWKSPTFVLVSPGAEFNDPVNEDSDYFADELESTGVIDNEDYFLLERADNITNFQ